MQIESGKLYKKIFTSTINIKNVCLQFYGWLQFLHGNRFCDM